jgi:hypothetical protein
MPGTGGTITGATDAEPVPSTGTATDDLFSSRPRPELGGNPVDTCLHPWRRSDQSGVLQKNPVLHLYISCYVTVSKLVLSYLSLRLLPHDQLFFSGTKFNFKKA